MAKFTHQSHIVISSFETVTRTAGGNAPPEMNAFTPTYVRKEGLVGPSRTTEGLVG